MKHVQSPFNRLDTIREKQGKVGRFLWLLLAVALSIAANSARAQTPDWPSLGFKPLVANTFSLPTSVTHAGDGSQRLFVEQKVGIIRVIQNSNVISEPFLDISSRVLS